MPPTSTSLSDEGACIVSFFVVRKGLFNGEELRRLLVDVPATVPGSSGCRSFSDVQSDIKAVSGLFCDLPSPSLILSFLLRSTLHSFALHSKSRRTTRELSSSASSFRTFLFRSFKSTVGPLCPSVRHYHPLEVAADLSFSPQWVTSVTTPSLESELSSRRPRRSWAACSKRRTGWTTARRSS